MKSGNKDLWYPWKAVSLPVDLSVPWFGRMWSEHTFKTLFTISTFDFDTHKEILDMESHDHLFHCPCLPLDFEIKKKKYVCWS
jgi:hypothetical protein